MLSRVVGKEPTGECLSHDKAWEGQNAYDIAHAILDEDLHSGDGPDVKKSIYVGNYR